ncbi:MAG: M1 family metallopeptidase [Pseudomonadota bacterium]
MKAAAVVVACLIAASLAGCKPQSPAAAQPPPTPRAAPEVAPVLLTEDAHDVHSYAQPVIARVTHVDLELSADFTAHTLAGTAALDVQTAADGYTLTLDTNGLAIESVTDQDGKSLAWTLGAVDKVLGAPLQIQLGSARRAIVHYKTSANALALQWLTPAQTAGKKQPYLFNQSEPILTRTWIPTQDSPGIRQTWSARIVAPAALTVVMSADMLGPQPGATPETRVWRFNMEHPVAPYLMAIVIGDLKFQSLGKRTGVYTEPSMLPAAAAEFVDVEKMIEAAEALYGPYRWGRYDLLVLPPSFPYGGMENPRLTFVTPTIIAGDKSLVSLISHELAHSWSGNLVTNATWADFWLNEGFTDYFNARIIERVYGAEAAEMLADLGWDDLQDAIKLAGGMNSPDTRLHIDLRGRDPDEGQTQIPYQKGATFLRTIEAAVGRERWDAYLRAYFNRHAFQPQTSAGFLEDLRANLIHGDAVLEKKLGLDDWVYGLGMPANAVHVSAVVFRRIDAAAATFATKGGTGLDVGSWNSAERVRFLNRLPRKLSSKQLGAVSDLFNLADQHNSEVRFAWLQLAIANRYPPAQAQTEDFLMSMGRRKFVLPLYRSLMAQGQWGQAIARRVYAAARPGYHSVTVNSVDKVVTAKPQ